MAKDEDEFKGRDASGLQDIDAMKEKPKAEGPERVKVRFFPGPCSSV